MIIFCTIAGKIKYDWMFFTENGVFSRCAIIKNDLSSARYIHYILFK